MPTVTFKHTKGGEKLEERLRRLASMKVIARVGFLDRATYPDSNMSVAYVAYCNEYGFNGNPPRPFLKETERKNVKKWAKGIRQHLIASGHITQANMMKAYEAAALVAVGDVKRTIQKWPHDKPRPNSEKTIMRKAARARKGKHVEAIDPMQVLIDSGTMISSVGYEVKKV